MNTLTWTPDPINVSHIPTLRQPVYLQASTGEPGKANSYSRARYLSRRHVKGHNPIPLITQNGKEMPFKQACLVGAKWGQERLILSPLVTDGLDMESYAVKLANLWGLNEFGWYAAVHRDTQHHHIHFILETEAKTGARVTSNDALLSTWKRHAEMLSTNILGLCKGREVLRLNEWKREYA